MIAIDPVKISRVDMDLAFSSPDGDAIDRQQAESSLVENLKRTLRSIDAQFRDEDVRVERENDLVKKADDEEMLHAHFTLRGQNCANMAYKIEQLVS